MAEQEKSESGQSVAIVAKEVEALSHRLASFSQLRLSAFDNLKLVMAVIDADFSEPISQPPVAYEVIWRSTAVDADDNKPNANEHFYAILWLGSWINCGRSNSYDAKISLPYSQDSVDKSSVRELNVPVLSMQQVEFMCMENAHFDHC